MQYSAFNFLKLIVFFSRLFRYYNKVCFGDLVQVFEQSVQFVLKCSFLFRFEIED